MTNQLVLAHALRPFITHGVGFERLDDMLKCFFPPQQKVSYPPFNILKLNDNEYQLSLAVAGFREEELTVKVVGDVLSIAGTKIAPKTDQSSQILHHGIANRAFTREFALDEHVEIANAVLEYGELKIDLIRRSPEPPNVKTIKITSL